MIELTKLNGAPVLVNPDLIRTVEATPDTVLKFIDGDSLIVREKPREVSAKVVRYKQECGISAVKESSAWT